ncbi:MAG TPA: DUF6529 family protein [Acidimicrobiia bacterium]|nr:DUF6529 family protein [Acidimicrobiia bacterium]
MTAPAETAPPRAGLSSTSKLLLMLVLGAAVAVALGVYANQHTPTGRKPYPLFFSGMIELKVWFATLALALACVQLLLAARIYGKISIPKTAPAWLGDAHRLTGTLAFAVTLPVAYQCLWGLGFETMNTRVVLHGIFGCAFYGAFVVKVLSVRVKGLRNWVLPVAGGLVFAALVGVYLTSSVWFFTSSGQALF